MSESEFEWIPQQLNKEDYVEVHELRVKVIEVK